MGEVIGLDFQRAEWWLMRQYGFSEDELIDLFRRMKIIDDAIMEMHRDYQEKKTRSEAISRSKAGSPIRRR